eukprot:COSAG06_NODE_802_length_12194_cov_5.561637_9_plen_91_part_00
MRGDEFAAYFSQPVRLYTSDPRRDAGSVTPRGGRTGQPTRAARGPPRARPRGRARARLGDPYFTKYGCIYVMCCHDLPHAVLMTSRTRRG